MACARSPIASLLAAAVVILALAGCVERTETIRIAADGSITHHVEFVADGEQELYPGRVPVREAGWRIERSKRYGADGEVKKHVLEATRTFGETEAPAATFAAADDPRGNVHLGFPTEVIFERRSDGTYCHFRRVYDARPWGYVAVPRQRILAERGFESMDDVDVDRMSQEERARLVLALLETEAAKHLVFARLAFEDVTPDAPPDAWLAVRSAVRARAGAVDADHLAELLARGDDPAAQAELAGAGERIETAMHEATVAALASSCGYGEADLAAYTDRLARHERRYEITEGLGAERFEIIVEMPGSITAANTDAIEGRRVTWTFAGDALRDCSLELMATSRVGR